MLWWLLFIAFLLLYRHQKRSGQTQMLKMKIIYQIRPILYTGGSRVFDRTPYFCSLKLILSLNIKYCMIMCAIVCRNLHSGIFWKRKYHNFVSIWGCTPTPLHIGLPTRSNQKPLLKSLHTGLQMHQWLCHLGFGWLLYFVVMAIFISSVWQCNGFTILFLLQGI